ncbi:MAG TPA: ABC transporter ATP-binding protein, partial [Microthrixaceae bacterium]|nr:ABC transporter ATP-binding protein [Microthrixaceae bacterium]
MSTSNDKPPTSGAGTTGDAADTTPDGSAGTDYAQSAKVNEGARGAMGRFGAAGMPLDRSKDLGGSVRRLAGQMRPESVGLIGVVALAVISVTLLVLGPRILGNATQTIVDGVVGQFKGGPGIDFSQLHRLLLTAAAIYVVATTLAYAQGWLLAGVVQRSMFRLRAAVETKLNRMPLSHVDRQARGDLLSRVTNDIDNVAQSLQQTLSQMLTSTLTIVGVLVMMFTISWELALIALVTVPLSLWTVKAIAQRSKPRFIAQWRHTGALNAQVEEAFTGHALIRVLGRQEDVRRRFDEENEQLFKASFGAQFISGTIQPAMMFFGNLNYVAIAVVGGMKVAGGS